MLEIIECIGADIFSEQFGDSPQLVAFLEAHFAGTENTPARRQLLEAADESEFSLHQWVESLSIAQAWLDARGLELAMDLLRRRKNKNKQIFMITDGKPTCMKVGINYYKNAFGLDPKILNKTYNLAAVCKKNGVRINTFMIASDPYLMEFVEKFTEINDGSAYFADLQNLGSMIFKDYNRNKVKRY